MLGSISQLNGSHWRWLPLLAPKSQTGLVNDGHLAA